MKPDVFKRRYPVKSLAISLIIVAVVAAWYGANYNGPLAKPANAPSSEFSAVRAISALRDVLGEEVAHPAGSEPNAAVRSRLVKQLSSIGLTIEETPFSNDGVSMCNVIATLPGTDPSKRPVIVATHYDSVEQGPGAADAGSCVGALLEVARITSLDAANTSGDRADIVFLFTDGEEWVRGIGHGLNGAMHFVDSAHPLLDRDPVVVNFDARGAAGPSLLYETSRNNLTLMRAILPELPRPAFTASSYVAVYDLLPNATDFTVFKKSGFDGLNFAFIDDPHRYHTPQDTIANLDPRSVQHHGENALAMVRFLSTQASSDWDDKESAVFFTVLGRWVIAYPQRIAVFLAIGVLLLQLIGIGLSVRRGMLISALLRSIAISLILLIVVAATGFMWRQLDHFRPQSSHGFGPLDPYLVGGLWIWVLGMGIFVLRLTQSLNTESVWHAIWLLAAVFGLLLAILLPGFSYLFLVTGLPAGLAGLLPHCKSKLTIVVVSIVSIFLVPIGWQFGVALGLRMISVLAVLFALIVAPLIPLFVPVDIVTFHRAKGQVVGKRKAGQE